MNFLQLCQRLNTEAGLSGPGPSAVSGQVGMNAKLVGWVLAAHQEIQQKHQDWAFDWLPVQQALAAGTDRYAPADWGLQVRGWDGCTGYVYTTAAGRETRACVPWLPWRDFAALPVGAQPGLPAWWSVAPDKRVCFYPAPADGLTFEAECYQAPQLLAANTDVPRLPAEYHLAIVWRGVMFYCGHDENASLWNEAKANFDRLMARMQDTELPGLDMPGALV